MYKEGGMKNNEDLGNKKGMMEGIETCYNNQMEKDWLEGSKNWRKSSQFRITT